MSSDFAVIRPNFWKRGTGKRIRGQKDVQILAMYLMSAPSNESIGIYFCEREEMAQHTGLTVEEIDAALVVLAEEDFAYYDTKEELVWVPNMARVRFGEELAPKDKRRGWVAKELTKLKGHRFVDDFVSRYADGYGLEPISRDVQTDPKRIKDKPLTSPLQAPSEEEKGAFCPQEGAIYTYTSSYTSSYEGGAGGNELTGEPGKPKPHVRDVDLAERARMATSESGCDRQSVSAQFGQPHTWPEVKAVLTHFQAVNGAVQNVARSNESRVKAILMWFEAGRTVEDVNETLTLAQKDEFWRQRTISDVLKELSRLDDFRAKKTTARRSGGKNGPRQPNHPGANLKTPEYV